MTQIYVICECEELSKAIQYFARKIGYNIKSFVPGNVLMFDRSGNCYATTIRYNEVNDNIPKFSLPSHWHTCVQYLRDLYSPVYCMGREVLFKDNSAYIMEPRSGQEVVIDKDTIRAIYNRMYNE